MTSSTAAQQLLTQEHPLPPEQGVDEPDEVARKQKAVVQKWRPKVTMADAVVSATRQTGGKDMMANGEPSSDEEDETKSKLPPPPPPASTISNATMITALRFFANG